VGMIFTISICATLDHCGLIVPVKDIMLKILVWLDGKYQKAKRIRYF